MNVIPYSDLEILAKKSDEYYFRYDISESVYRDLLEDQEEYWEFLILHPDCYDNQEIWDKAKTINLYIRVGLMLKITEFLELEHSRKYKAG